MNMLDLHTREKVNKIHIAEMHREAQNRHFLRNVKSPGITIRPKVRIGMVLTIAIVALLVGTLLSSVSAIF